MRASMLRELSDVFSLEAFEQDRRGRHEEADRLWDISEELSERQKKSERRSAHGVCSKKSGESKK